MKPSERRTYWRKVIRIQLKYQRRYAPQIEQALKWQINEFIDRYKEAGQQALNDLELWNTKLLEVYAKLYRNVAIDFANYQYAWLGKQSRQRQKLTMGFNAEWTQEVNNWLNVYGLQLVSTVSKNQREVLLDIINRVIQEGVQEGDGIDVVTNKILRAIREYRDGTGPAFRAERIARTETMRAANIGHVKGAGKHNFQVLKEWISAKDKRTRKFERNDEFDHYVLDGQQREMFEKFNQVGRTGKIASVDNPGGGEGDNPPAAFVINCRCTIAFIPKRDTQGNLIKK